MTKRVFTRFLCALSVTVLILVTGLCILSACDKSDGKISVIFDYNDGSGNTETRRISEGESLFTPVRDGYFFAGWSTDRDENVGYEKLTDGITLYAIWEIATYTVKFYVEDTLIATRTVRHGQSAEPPTYAEYADLIPEGYALGDWEGGDFSNVTKNLNIFANCVPADSNVKFLDREGDGAAQIAEYLGQTGKRVPLPPNPVRDGFTFEGWYRADGRKYTETDVFEENLVYSAHWTLILPTVPAVSGENKITYGDTLRLTAGNATKYDFITYSYSWHNGDLKICDGQSLTYSDRLAAGAHTLTLQVSATSSINGKTEMATNRADIAISVEKAILTASAADVQLTYGDKLPGNFALTYTGFKYGDTAQALGRITVSETNFTENAGVGKYYALLGFESSDYEIKAADGGEVSVDITVAKKQIAFEYKFLKEFDGNVLSFTATKTDGLLEGHTLSLAAQTTGVNVGEYIYPAGVILTQVTVKDSQNQNLTSNYAISLSIKCEIQGANIDYKTPAAVTYDGQPHRAEIIAKQECEIKYSLDGGNFDIDAPSFTDAGAHRVYIRITAKNYFPVHTYFELVINKAPVTVDIDDKTVIAGNPLPEFTYSITGATMDSPLTLKCDYEQDGATGEYEIDCDRTHPIFGNENYNVTVNKGALKVVSDSSQIPAAKPTLTLHLAGNFAIIYGEAMPEFTIESVEGLIDGDRFEDVVSGTPEVVCGYADSPSAGQFALTVRGLRSDKYDILTVGTLNIGKATLTITVGAHAPIVFGSPIPTDFAYTADGFAFADGKELLDSLTFSTDYNQISPVSQEGYDVYADVYGLNLANYDIKTVSSKLTVIKATPTILVEKDVYELNYTGNEYDFKAEIGAISTNFDENSDLLYDSPRGKDGGVYKVTITSPETDNFNSATAVVTVKILAAKIGYSLYAVEDALEKGGDILLIGNAFISKDAVLKAGSTLTLPCREDGKAYEYGYADFDTKSYYLNPLTDEVTYILTLGSGVNMQICGTLIIGGEIGQANGRYNGHTSGAHSVLDTAVGSQITIYEFGVVDCIGGFITGQGELTVNDGGTLKQNFTVIDFRGGTSTVGSYQKGKIAPFNIFDLPNITVQQTVYSGAKVVAHCDLFAGGQHNITDVNVVANEDALLNLGQDAYIVAKHNLSYGDIAPDFTMATYGDITVGSIKITIKVMISATVDMADVYCPLSYIIDLHVYGTLTTKNTFKLLPGASLTVEKGGTLNLLKGAGLTVYTGDWKDQLSLRTDGKPITESRPGEEARYPHDKGDATLLIKGTLNVSSEAAISGIIQGDDGATVTIENGCALTITTKEGIAVKGEGILGTLNQIWHETAVITKTAILRNGDGTEFSADADSTYAFADGKWNAR